MPSYPHSGESLPNNWRRPPNSETLAVAANKNANSTPKPANMVKECSYCIHLGKPKEEFQSHFAVDPITRQAQCPELKLVICSVCNKTGHSKLFCTEFSQSDDRVKQKKDIRKTADQLKEHLNARRHEGQTAPNQTPRPQHRNPNPRSRQPRDHQYAQPRPQFQSKPGLSQTISAYSLENTAKNSPPTQAVQSDAPSTTRPQQFHRPVNAFRPGPGRGGFNHPMPRNPPSFQPGPANNNYMSGVPVYNGPMTNPPMYSNGQMYGNEYVPQMSPEMLISQMQGMPNGPMPMSNGQMASGPVMPSFSMPQLPPSNVQYYIPGQNVQLPVVFANPYEQPGWQQPGQMNYGQSPYY